MNWIENLLIVAGASIDIFVAMECQGSLVKSINKKQLSVLCIAAGMMQTIALFIGFYISDLYCRKFPESNETLLGEIIAFSIFIALGIRLLLKALKNEFIIEHLIAKFEIAKTIHVCAVTSVYTILAGIAFGFMGTNLPAILIMTVILSIIFIVAGINVGYNFGFEQKTKTYFVGTLLLFLAGADIMVRYILHLF